MTPWRRSWRPSLVPFRRGGFIAWGYDNGTFTPAQVAAWARARYGEGGWLALELDDFDNRRFWADHRQACHGNGLKAACWFTEGYNIATTPDDADVSIAELEGPFGGPGDWEGINNAINWGQLPDCRLAIITNFSDAQDGEADALVEHDFHCITEAYMNENPNADPGGLDRMARALGFAASQPAFGLYPVGGQPPPDYSAWASWNGAEYLVENVYR